MCVFIFDLCIVDLVLPSLRNISLYLSHQNIGAVLALTVLQFYERKNLITVSGPRINIQIIVKSSF